MTKTNKKGFTLIELLVVVAIIGILATVVLASLGSARSKAKDSAAKAALSQARAEAEIIALDAGGYTGICTADKPTGIKNFLDDAQKQTGNTPVCADSATEWAASVELISKKDNASQHFCVDSTGYAGVQDAGANGTKCAAA